jgi:hypothetical protein
MMESPRGDSTVNCEMAAMTAVCAPMQIKTLRSEGRL